MHFPDWNWEAIGAIGTALLAAATLVTVLFLKRAAYDQTQALRHQTDALKLQTDALNLQTKALEAQAKTLQISADQFITSELLTMGRWLADSPRLLVAMEKAEHEYSFEGENGAAVFADFMDQILRQCELMERGHAELWIPYFQDKLAEYPQVRNLINLHPDWYNQKLLTDLAKEASDLAKKAA
jgi:hypothetical protein